MRLSSRSVAFRRLSRPATQSFSLLGTYSSVQPGRYDDQGTYGRMPSACAEPVVTAGTSDKDSPRNDADCQPAEARTRGLHEHVPSQGVVPRER